MRRFRRAMTGVATFALLGALVVAPASADHKGGVLLTFHQPQFLGLTAQEAIEQGATNDPDGCGVELEAGEVGWAFITPGNPAQNFFTHLDVEFNGDEQTWDTNIDPGDATLVSRTHPSHDGAGLLAFTTDAENALTAVQAWGFQNDNRFVLTHVCVPEAEIEIVKTAVEDTITVGDHAAFDITVTSVGFVAAQNVTIDDELPNDVLDWEVVSENGVDAEDLLDPACAITDGNTLFCDVGDLAPTSSFTVRVQTTEPIALGSELCNTDLDNTAFADADNAEEVSDDATIRVACGAVQIDKVRKVPGEEDTQPLEGAGFTLFEGHDAPDDGTEVAVDPPGEVFTDEDGVACFDGLPTDSDFTARETTTPEGYATADDTNVSTAGEADCDGIAGEPEVVTVENDPLTDLSITVTAQDPGATISLIECYEGEPDDLGDPIGDSGDFADPAELDVEDLLEGVYTCRIEIDP